MNNKNNEHICLFIEPYVHINIKKDNVLLYNTLNGDQLVYNDSPEITALLSRMMNPQNLNVVIENKRILKDENLKGFMETCRKKEFIDWYSYSKKDSSHRKTVAMPALLNFHRDRKKMALDPERDWGQDILKYLRNIHIYINSYHGDRYNSPLFREGYRQFPFPYWTAERNEITCAEIQQFLEQVRDLRGCRVTLLGGNIFQYNELDSLMAFLARFPLEKELGVFYKDISPENLEKVDWKKLTDISLKIFVEPQMDKNTLVDCIELLKKFEISSNYRFTIQSEPEADALESALDLVAPSQFSVNAFYNGSNYKFLKENIFIDKPDLSDPAVSKKDIYARDVMNPNFFGHIIALSSGKIHSNLNEEPIGGIRQPVKQALLKEMSEGNGWFRLRKELTPCGDCIYHQICPPVSNYEYALSRNNLCWLHQDTGEHD